MKLKTVKRAVGGLFGLSALAMAWAAATSDSDKGLRSDGPLAASGGVQGDPRGGAAQHAEGDKTRPDSTTDEAKQAVASGGSAEETAADPDSDS